MAALIIKCSGRMNFEARVEGSSVRKELASVNVQLSLRSEDLEEAMLFGSIVPVPDSESVQLTMERLASPVVLTISADLLSSLLSESLLAGVDT